MKTLKHELYQSLKTLALALFLSLGVSYVYAWTGPTAAAPNNNTAAPLNVSATSQVKSGGLGVGAFTADSVTVGGTANATAITAPRYCIGTSCITSWPSGASLGGSGTAGYMTSWTGATTLGSSGLQIHGPYGGSTAGSYYHVGSWGGNGWGPDILVERARYADTTGVAVSNIYYQCYNNYYCGDMPSVYQRICQLCITAGGTYCTGYEPPAYGWSQYCGQSTP